MRDKLGNFQYDRRSVKYLLLTYDQLRMPVIADTADIQVGCFRIHRCPRFSNEKYSARTD